MSPFSATSLIAHDLLAVSLAAAAFAARVATATAAVAANAAAIELAFDFILLQIGMLLFIVTLKFTVTWWGLREWVEEGLNVLKGLSKSFQKAFKNSKSFQKEESPPLRAKSGECI
jgi:hypothetical protein